MKQKIVFILGVLFSVDVVYSEYQYCPVSNKDSGYAFNRKTAEIWSGSWEDLKAISALVRDKFPFELTKHLGRDIAALKPATLEEMKLGKEKGYLNNWEEYSWDVYHEPSNIIDEFVKIFPKSEDVMQIANGIVKVIGGKVSKYTTQSGDEVVYNKKDGKIILDEKLGTRNLGDNYKWLGMVIEEVTEEIKRKGVLPSWFPSEMIGRIVQLCFEYPSHREVDIVPHEKNNQYKYAGILFESDSDGRFYIVDGQTGKRMTKKQVEDFPTTFSDMWNDKGLVCVESDAIDIVPPKENRQSAQNASSEDDNDDGKDETLPVIDTTKLEVLLKNRISLLSRIVAAGRKLTEEENRKENSLLDSAMTELASLVEIISLANVSDDKKIKMLDDIANRCMPYVEKINGLLCEAEARGIATIKTGNLSAKLQENVRKIRNSTGKISND